jgi:hypothetical protein
LVISIRLIRDTRVISRVMRVTRVISIRVMRVTRVISISCKGY